jgi:hypothetical protein
MARMGVITMHTLFCRETLKQTIWKDYSRTNSAVSQHKIEECYYEDADIRGASVLRNTGNFPTNETTILLSRRTLFHELVGDNNNYLSELRLFLLNICCYLVTEC